MKLTDCTGMMLLPRNAKLLEAFNGVDGLEDTFPYNDKWSDAQMTKFIEVSEAMED
jgi:hypothetical protein